MARNWKVNAGRAEKARSPETKVWVKFRAIDSDTGEMRISMEKHRAGNLNWKHRNLPFDIMEATTDDD